MNIFQQVIILSGELAGLTTGLNASRSENLRLTLKDLDIKFDNAIGVYKNNMEAVFVVLPKNKDEFETIQDLAFKQFSQESILYQDSNGIAWLKYKAGHEQQLGRIREVNPKYVEQLENYTILNNRIYTTERKVL